VFVFSLVVKSGLVRGRSEEWWGIEGLAGMNVGKRYGTEPQSAMRSFTAC